MVFFLFVQVWSVGDYMVDGKGKELRKTGRGKENTRRGGEKTINNNR